ncbi:MAG: hypothetical protein JSR34_09920 [Proteobacteria bacterium]|nr:hypothetical protein [Pseudomonadota bacterium]
MPSLSHVCLGALALELRPGAQASRIALDRAQAAQLADGIARDLAALVPDAATFDLAVLAAHYDPVELLRPDWPLHAALDALAQRAPRVMPPPPHAGEGWGGGAARILAFGAHASVLPDPVPAPEADYAQGTMRLLPFALRGDPADPATGSRIAMLASSMEEVLLERGMAGAATALFAQDAFGAPIEHARYLTIHDLAALMAMQYEHAGLASLWPLLETALLAPEHEAWLDAPPEPLARYADGEVRIGLLDAESWRAGGFAPKSTGDDARKLELAFERYEARQRQFAAVLAAHGVAAMFVHCAAGHDARASITSSWA